MNTVVEAVDPTTYVADDYACAEVTTVWRSGSAGGQLIFAVVEMLLPSAERDPTDRLTPAQSIRLPDSGDEVHCGRAHLEPVSAVAWYRSCVAGHTQLPSQMTSAAANTVATGSLVDEPAWPIVPFENRAFWEYSQLWGARPGGVRRHQLVQLTPEHILRSWTADDKARARAWLKDRLPIDVFAEPFLLGSVHLILPNPLFAAAWERLGNEHDEELFFEVAPHPGRSVRGLEVYFKESRPGATAIMMRFTLDGERVRLTFPHRPHDTHFAICCPRRGLLYDSPRSAFIAQVGGAGHLVGRQRRVTVPGTRRRAEDTFNVAVTEHNLPFLVGEPLDAGIAKVSTLYAEKEEEERARSFEQYWFDGDREKATELIRSLIGQANESVFMVDPYFGATELLRFAAAASRGKLPVRILAAEEYLRKNRPSTDAETVPCSACGRALPPAGSPQTHGELLEQQLAHVLGRDPTLSIEVRVALGDPAPIHDRFLCIDATVRTLGSSLNEFGSRGTLMLKVPAPSEIRSRLESAWNAGEPLADFNKRRAKSAQPADASS